MQRIISVNDKVIPFQHHPLTLINYVLRDRNGHIERLLDNSGITVSQFQNPDLMISYQQYAQLVKNCLEQTGDPFLGLAFGKELSVHSHGLIGLTVLNQPTVADAVNTAIKYKKAVSPITTLSLLPAADEVEVAVEEALGFKELEQFFTEVLYSSFMTGFRTLTCDENCWIRFYFKYTVDEKGIEEYQKYLGPQLLFSQPRNRMRSDAAYFQRKIMISNSVAAQALEEQVRKLFRRVANHEGIIGLIRGLLVAPQHEFPSLELTAEKMNTSTSTIKRKLREYNTSYQKILNEVRMEIAVDYLQNSDKSIKEICYDLGYQEPSTFSRAFRQWTNMSPQQYRDQYRRTAC
ncbi:AraC family transcriptional regulator [Bacterioplanoides sp.]|uniref:AraC family transcriptional regulator n=1 Tax=Bacterioplanoides sp. TaxID=2066072 RepID=UPI003B590FEE